MTTVRHSFVTVAAEVSRPTSGPFGFGKAFRVLVCSCLSSRAKYESSKTFDIVVFGLFHSSHSVRDRNIHQE